MAHSRSRRRGCTSLIGTERNCVTDHVSSSYQICHDVACIPLVWHSRLLMCESLGGLSSGKFEPIMIGASKISAVSKSSSVCKCTLSSLIKLLSRREDMHPASTKRMRILVSVGCRTPLSIESVISCFFEEPAHPETPLLHLALGRIVVSVGCRTPLSILRFFALVSASPAIPAKYAVIARPYSKVSTYGRLGSS